MLLAIDIGNTNIVFGIHDSKGWINHWRIQTDSQKTDDEYEVIFRSLFVAGKISRTKVSQMILSSVVPALVRPVTEMLAGLFSEATLTIVNPEIYDHLPIKVRNPFEIGADLVANAVAAFQRFGPLTMIVDFGTALTFTTIGKESEIRGVAIAPGLQTAGSTGGKNSAVASDLSHATTVGVRRKYHSGHSGRGCLRICRPGRFDN
ncbi:MAG: type III pantothenate kinase [Prolixibacteraceae bacterium]|nr:type III pantothenate kinase [Prolixibacteraceae bacterium]